MGADDDYVAQSLAAWIVACNAMMGVYAVAAVSPFLPILPPRSQQKPVVRVVAWHGHTINSEGFQDD